MMIDILLVMNATFEITFYTVGSLVGVCADQEI